MKKTKIYFEDIKEGDSYKLGPLFVSKEEVIDFAKNMTLNLFT